MIINTNIQALKTSNILNESNKMLSRSLARLSSGSKIVNPKDDAAGLAVSSRLKGQISRVDSALSNIGNGMSWTQTQDGFMKTLEGAFRRMGELAMLSMDATKSSANPAVDSPPDFDDVFEVVAILLVRTGAGRFGAAAGGVCRV